LKAVQHSSASIAESKRGQPGVNLGEPGVNLLRPTMREVGVEVVFAVEGADRLHVAAL